jgi:hypothetical protein
MSALGRVSLTTNTPQDKKEKIAGTPKAGAAEAEYEEVRARFNLVE